MSSGAYEKVKAGRLTFKDGTLATRSKSIDKKKKKKKTGKGLEPSSDDVRDSESEVQIKEEAAGEGVSGEVIYTIDAAKKMKYDELFPVEAKKFSYDPKAKVKSVEQALDDRVKKKADRFLFMDRKCHKKDNEGLSENPLVEYTKKVSALSSLSSKSGMKMTIHQSEKMQDASFEDSDSDIVIETSQRFLSSEKRSTNIKKASSFSSSISTYKMEQEAHEGLSSFGLLERSYSVNKREASPSNRQKTPALPQSAAMFYIGHSPLFEVVETCKSTVKLNAFLKARRDEVSSGVPGRFLHAVMREDQISDVGSVVSSIIYAFYLNETTDDDYACVVPIVNMKRTDLNTRIELKWLLDSCQIDQNSLIFLDEIDLSYYDLFGSLQVISVDGNHVLHDNHNPAKQEDSSFCTFVAEKFVQTSPETLTGQCFSRFLLAGILLDTANLTSPRCTSPDKYMATLLINGAGRFGCSGLYQLLRIKKYDVSGLKVVDILRKDFKKWLKGKPDGAVSRTNSSHIGMSSIGISITQLHSHQESSVQDIKHFQQSERLRLLMVVSGYYDSQKNFKREVLVSAESTQLMKILLNYLNSSKLPLKVMHQPVLGDEMRVFEIDNQTSRKTIEVLLEEFGRNSKH